MDQKSIGTDRNKNHLAMIIERSTQDLHDRVNMQKYILLNVLGKVKDRTAISLFPVESTGDEVTRTLFRKVLTETIEVLEETKKAFKSKRLEELRKRLMDVLKETA
ncbi:MAG: hypothetical protein FJ115_02310 [Deltaproteobacteria bacterium]|nr:hypothetical protein [Deltaproteobacteria bacterium]MBM4322370.1 hypothetical protein [Deltaproteobacteria bacterium]